MNAPSPTPKHLGRSGRALWRDITTSLELDQHEAQLLVQACRCKDRLDALADDIRKRGVVLPDGTPNPSVVEERLQDITLARLVAAMRLPDDLKNPDSGRPQRRGPRGVYHIVRGQAS